MLLFQALSPFDSSLSFSIHLCIQINSLSPLTLAHSINSCVHLYPSPHLTCNVSVRLTHEWTAAALAESLWQSIKLDYHSGVHQSQIISAQLIKVRIFTAFYSSGSGSTRINCDLRFHFNFKKLIQRPKAWNIHSAMQVDKERERLNSCWGWTDTKIGDIPGLDNLTRASKSRCVFLTQYLCRRPNRARTKDTSTQWQHMRTLHAAEDQSRGHMPKTCERGSRRQKADHGCDRASDDVQQNAPTPLWNFVRVKNNFIWRIGPILWAYPLIQWKSSESLKSCYLSVPYITCMQVFHSTRLHTLLSRVSSQSGVVIIHTHNQEHWNITT